MSRRAGASTGGAGQKLQRVLTVVRQAGSGCDVDAQLLECLQLAKAVCAREPDAAAEFLEEARPLADLIRRHAALDVKVRSSAGAPTDGSGAELTKLSGPSLHWQVVEAAAHVVAAGAQAGHALQQAPPRLEEGDEDAGSDEDSDSEAVEGVPWWDLWTALLEAAAGALAPEPSADALPISVAEAQRLTMLLAALVSAFLRIVRPPPAFGKGRWRRALRFLPAAASAASAGAGGAVQSRRAKALQPIYGEDSDSDSDGDSDAEEEDVAVEDEHAAAAAAEDGAARRSSARVAATSLLRPAVQAAVLRAARRAPDSLVALDAALSRIGGRLMQAAAAFGPELRPVEVVGAALVRLPLLQLELRRLVAASAVLAPATEPLPLPRMLAGVHWLCAASAHLARRLPASQALIESLLADARLGTDAAAVALLRGDLRSKDEAASAPAAAAAAAALSCAALAPHCFSPPLLATARGWQAAVVAASRRDKEKAKGKGGSRSRKEKEREKDKASAASGAVAAVDFTAAGAAASVSSSSSSSEDEHAFFVTAGVTPASAQESLAELQGLCGGAMGSGAVLAALTQLLMPMPMPMPMPVSRSSAAGASDARIDAGNAVTAAVETLRSLITAAADVADPADAAAAAFGEPSLDTAAAASWLAPSASALRWPWKRLQRFSSFPAAPRAGASCSSEAAAADSPDAALLRLLSRHGVCRTALLSLAWVCVPASASGPTADDAAVGGAGAASTAKAGSAGGSEGEGQGQGQHAVMPPAIAVALPDAARLLAAAASGAVADADAMRALAALGAHCAPLAAAARSLAGSSPAFLSLAADAAAAVTAVHAALLPPAGASAAGAAGAAGGGALEAAAAVARLLATAWQPLAAGLRQLPRYSPPMQELLMRAFRRLVSAAETCLSAQPADAAAWGVGGGALCAFVLESGPAAARALLAHVSGAWEAGVVDAPPLLPAGEVEAGDGEGRSVDAQHVTLLLETCAACGALLATALRNDAVFASAPAAAARASVDMMARAFAAAVRHGYAVLRLKGVVEVESGAAYNVDEGGSDDDDDEEEEEDETEGLTDFSVVCAAMLGALLGRLTDSARKAGSDTLTDAGLAAAAAAWTDRAGGDSATSIAILMCKPVADRLLPLFQHLVGRAAVFEADAAMDILAGRIVAALG